MSPDSHHSGTCYAHILSSRREGFLIGNQKLRMKVNTDGSKTDIETWTQEMTDYCSELAGVVLRRHEALPDTQGQDMIQANELWKTQLFESEAKLQATDAKWFSEEAKAGRSTEGMPQLKGCKLEYVDDFDVFISLQCDDLSNRRNTLPLSTGSAPQ